MVIEKLLLAKIIGCGLASCQDKLTDKLDRNDSAKGPSAEGGHAALTKFCKE